MTEIPTKTGGASPSAFSFQNLTFRKNVSALPFWACNHLIGGNWVATPSQKKKFIKTKGSWKWKRWGENMELTVAVDDVIASLWKHEELQYHLCFFSFTLSSQQTHCRYATHQRHNLATPSLASFYYYPRSFVFIKYNPLWLCVWY